jgi:hypothetical protein
VCRCLCVCVCVGGGGRACEMPWLFEQALQLESPPSTHRIHDSSNHRPKQEGHIAHDDKFGEVIPDEEREWLAAQVYDCIMMQVGGWGRGGGVAVDGLEHAQPLHVQRHISGTCKTQPTV